MNKSQQIESERALVKHILVVEDDPILGDLLMEALQEAFYKVSHVLSGEMALSHLRTAPPDLLLLDYHLPGMNGLELASVLRDREEGKHLPILLMSADVPQGASSKTSLRMLRKPFELETLLHVVAELLVSGTKGCPCTEKAFSYDDDAR